MNNKENHRLRENEPDSDDSLENGDRSIEENKNEGYRSIDGTKTKRGRKKLPNRWSRVISMSYDDLSNVEAYDLDPDMQLSELATAPMSRGKNQKEFQPLFWPDNYILDDHDMTIAGN